MMMSQHMPVSEPPGTRGPLNRIADGIDRLNAAVGRAASWCCLVIVAVEFAAVVMRYAFGMGSIAVAELALYVQAALVMLAAAWTLNIGGHVRVDVFYAHAAPRTRALVDLCGALLFLIPFAVALGLVSVPYAARSWSIFERSRETSGLPFVYLLKTLIPVFALLIGLQGIAQAIRAALALTGPSAAFTR